jgi:hypothetical protein
MDDADAALPGNGDGLRYTVTVHAALMMYIQPYFAVRACADRYPPQFGAVGRHPKHIVEGETVADKRSSNLFPKQPLPKNFFPLYSPRPAVNSIPNYLRRLFSGYVRKTGKGAQRLQSWNPGA